jgi:hypothetical protein
MQHETKSLKFDENYYAYYTAKANYVIGLLVALGFFAALSLFTLRAIIVGTGGVVLVICLWDAIMLRREIKPLLQNHTDPPGACSSSGKDHSTSGNYAPAHTGVYTRLAPSPTFPGIGVFAIRDILAGTNVFAGDAGEMREINPNDLNGLDAEVKNCIAISACSRMERSAGRPTLIT